MHDMLRVAVVGGGPVGCLQAAILARLGCSVELHEMRMDIRQNALAAGRSINFALSHRGREALSWIGLEERAIAEGVPMFCRTVHKLLENGTTEVMDVPYGKENECLYSISRRSINELLLTACEEHGVKVFFGSKLQKIKTTLDKVDENTKVTASFQQAQGSSMTVTDFAYDALFGCDGFHSNTRAELARMRRTNINIQHIDHGYKELELPATNALRSQSLHIWPRGSYMLIALPNVDGSFTCTLFMPWKQFDEIQNDKHKIVSFFKANFPDFFNLMGESRLIDQFFLHPASALAMLHTDPWTDESLTVALMGDAAHAMCPFYGQGMNCGFQDCTTFLRLLNAAVDRPPKSCCNTMFSANGVKPFTDRSSMLTAFKNALAQYSDVRKVHTDVITQLSLENYEEMRNTVTSPLYLLRKKLDMYLNKLFPNHWIAQYSMVSFTTLPYAEVLKRRNFQNTVVKYFSYGSVFISVLAALYTAFKIYQNLKLHKRIN